MIHEERKLLVQFNPYSLLLDSINLYIQVYMEVYVSCCRVE